MYKFSRFLMSLALLLFSHFLISQSVRIEPANWWAGMKHSNVQLMMHAENIADFNVGTTYAGISVQKITRTENPNYLFVDIDILPDAIPGEVVFDFRHLHTGQQFTQQWPLLVRSNRALGQAGFDNSDVMYLITPDRFANGDTGNDAVVGMGELPNRAFKGGRHGGDIAGIRQHLGYIHDMGFSAIWLNPVLENNMPTYSYHGYSTTDFYRVDPRFGTNEDYRALADEARELGIKLIMDMIVNHIGLEHWWMKDLPTADWLNTWPVYTETNHAKTTLQDPHASQYDKLRYTDGWFVPTMPDLNQRNPLLAKYLIQNSIWWTEYLGLAGIRMDTYSYPEPEFMRQWATAMTTEYPNLNIVGEEWNLNPEIVSYWQRGKINPNGFLSDLPSLMDFPLQRAVVNALTIDEGFQKGWFGAYEMLGMDFLYPNPDALVIFPDNHDMSRIFQQLGEDYALLEMAMVYFLTMRGTPQLYYGTEIAMSNPPSADHGDIRADFPGGWPNDKTNAFTGKGLSAQQLQTRNTLRQLLHWRRTAWPVHHGQLVHFLPKDGIYVYFRVYQGQTVMVALNKNASPTPLELSRFKELIPNKFNAYEVLSGQQIEVDGSIILPAKKAIVLQLAN